MNELIKIKGLKKSFRGKEVLNGIDMSLFEGENLVLLGKSGTGKTVLIKCIVGLITPDEGNIKVFGQDLSMLNTEEWDALRKRVGFLFQGGAVYDSMTVRENLEFPLKRNLMVKDKKIINEMVMEALEHVGLADSVDKLPSELSGGMRKRMGLARTLILNPEIILYDEPTSGLDPLTAQEISDLIIKVQKKYNTSSIIITHDIKCIKTTANRMAMLRNGIISTEGPADIFMNNNDIEIKAYFS